MPCVLYSISLSAVDYELSAKHSPKASTEKSATFINVRMRGYFYHPVEKAERQQGRKQKDQIVWSEK